MVRRERAQTCIRSVITEISGNIYLLPSPLTFLRALVYSDVGGGRPQTFRVFSNYEV